MSGIAHNKDIGCKSRWLNIIQSKSKILNKQNFKCQKCLKIGHYTYECTGKRPYMYRESRSKELKRVQAGKESKNFKNKKRKMIAKLLEEEAMKKKLAKNKGKRWDDSDSSGSDSDSSDSDSSDSDSSDSGSSSSGSSSSGSGSSSSSSDED